MNLNFMNRVVTDYERSLLSNFIGTLIGKTLNATIRYVLL